MKKQDLRELAVADLVDKINAEVKNLKQAKLNHQVTPMEDNSQLRKTKREIARIKTILNQKNQN